MTARFNSRTGRTLALAIGLSLAAVACSSNSSSSSAAGGGSTTTADTASSSAASSAASSASSSDTSSGGSTNLSAETDTPMKGDCTAAKLGYPAIADFKGIKV